MMQSARRRPAIVLLFLSSHPGPSIAVAAICAALGVTTLEVWRVVIIGCAVLLGQFSVGLSNDWLDAGRDRVAGRSDKPAATGQIGVLLVRNSAIVAGIAGLSLTIFVGLPATAAHAVFIAAGWAYNITLKKTAFSVVPYIIGFGALPAIVTLANPNPSLPAGWAIAAGSTLGIAAHFANALPDLADDRATGIVGLPHRIGGLASSLITFAALAIATAIIVFGPGIAPSVVGWITLLVASALTLGGIALALSRPAGRPLFRLVILGAFVAVASLTLSGGQLAG